MSQPLASTSSTPSQPPPLRVFLSSYPANLTDIRHDPVIRVLHQLRNRLAEEAQKRRHVAADSASFLFLFVHNLRHPLQQLKADDVVLYIPTQRYRALAEAAERGDVSNEEVEAVRRKARTLPHAVIAVSSHPNAADGLDSPDHIPPAWRSAYIVLHREESYCELLDYLLQVRSSPEAARAYQPPSLSQSALAEAAAKPAHSQSLTAQPDGDVRRLLAASATHRLRVVISFAADDAELTDCHPQAVQLLASALNSYELFDCTLHSLHDTSSPEWSHWMEEAVRQAHYILFIPSARYRQRAQQPEGGAVYEMHAITERASADSRAVVCVTFPTILSPADNIPAGWPTERYELTGSEQSLQRLVYRLLGVEKGVKVHIVREMAAMPLVPHHVNNQ